MSNTDPSSPRSKGSKGSASNAPPTVDDAIEVRNVINRMLNRLEDDPELTAIVSTGKGPDDDDTVSGVKYEKELSIAEDKISKDSKFLAKSLEVKILHFFWTLNAAWSKNIKISRLRNVLLLSNQYVVSKMEQKDETTWVEFVLNRREAALSINNNNVAALLKAFHSLKNCKYAQDIKKNILYLRSKSALETRTQMSFERQYYTDLVDWFESTLDKNAERYLDNNPNPRSYKPSRGVMDSIKFVDKRIKYYKEKVLTDRRCMATYLMFSKFGGLDKWLCVVEGMIYIESEPDEMIDLEQDYMSFIFGLQFKSLH